jgi:Mor family transcriptional regulator
MAESEVLSEVRAAVFEQLGEKGAPLADYIETRLRKTLGGAVFYVPTPTLKERNTAVLADFRRTGDKAGVCARHDISISTFYRIIKGQYIPENLPDF